MASRTSRRAVISVLAAATTAALALAACGRSATGGGHQQGTLSPTKGLVVTTTPGTKPVSSVTWAVYRDVNSLDPIYAFDYPENTAVSLMCESLLKQSPNGDRPWTGDHVVAVADDPGIHDQPGGDVLGRAPRHPGQRR